MRRKVAAEVGDARGDAPRRHRPAAQPPVPRACAHAPTEGEEVEGAADGEDELHRDERDAQGEAAGGEEGEGVGVRVQRVGVGGVVVCILAWCVAPIFHFALIGQGTGFCGRLLGARALREQRGKGPPSGRERHAEDDAQEELERIGGLWLARAVHRCHREGAR